MSDDDNDEMIQAIRRAVADAEGVSVDDVVIIHGSPPDDPEDMDAIMMKALGDRLRAEAGDDPEVQQLLERLDQFFEFKRDIKMVSPRVHSIATILHLVAIGAAGDEEEIKSRCKICLDCLKTLGMDRNEGEMALDHWQYLGKKFGRDNESGENGN